MNQSFFDYLETIVSSEDYNAKIRLALAKLAQIGSTISFTLTKTINAVETSNHVKPVIDNKVVTINGTSRIFQEGTVLSFDPKKSDYYLDNKYLTISDFYSDDVLFCVSSNSKSPFSEQYFVISYDIDLLSKDVYVVDNRSNTLKANQSTLEKQRKLNKYERRKECVESYLAKLKRQHNLDQDASYMDVYVTMRRPTLRVLWNTLHEQWPKFFDSRPVERLNPDISKICKDLGINLDVGAADKSRMKKINH